MDFANNRAIRFLILTVSSVLAVIAVFSILRAGFAFWLYSYIGQWMTVRLGLDYYAAELMTVVVTTAIMFAVPGVGSLIISRKQRLLGAGLLIGGYVVMCGLVYTVGRNVYFNRVSGEPLRYYADTPQGREFSFTPGFHPRYGVPYKPYTQTVVQEELRLLRLQEEKRRKAEAEAQRQREIEEQKRLADEQRRHAEEQLLQVQEQRRQEEERLRAEAEARRQQQLQQQQEQDRLAAEARRREDLEFQRREAEAQRQHETGLRQLEAERQAREFQQQQREREEQKRQEAARRRQEEEARRRREETTRQVIGIGREVERIIRRRPN